MKKRKNIQKHFIRTISVLMAMTTLWVASALPASAATDYVRFPATVTDSLGNVMYAGMTAYTTDTTPKKIHSVQTNGYLDTSDQLPTEEAVTIIAVAGAIYENDEYFYYTVAYDWLGKLSKNSLYRIATTSEYAQGQNYVIDQSKTVLGVQSHTKISFSLDYGWTEGVNGLVCPILKHRSEILNPQS